MPTLYLPRPLWLLVLLMPLWVQAQTLPPIPSAPNLRNATGQRIGEWVITYTRSFKETTLPDSINYYSQFTYDQAGKLNGKARQFYRSGQKMWESIFIQIGARTAFDGPLVSFHENGNRMKTATYRNGLEQDTTLTWHADGKPESIIPTKDGLREGLIQFWSKTGVEQRGWFENGKKIDGFVLQKQIDTLWAEGKFEKAIPIAQKIVFVFSQLYGKQHTNYGAALNNLANLYQKVGQYDKVLPIYEESMAITEKQIGKQAPEYATKLGNLAQVYQAMAQYEKALALYQECLAIREKTVGKLNKDYSSTLGNLAGVYKLMGQYEKALSLYQESLSIDEKVLGRLHPSYAAALGNLADWHFSMGQYEKALPLFQESLTIREKALGKLHPDYARALSGLAFLYQHMGQYEKALALHKECLTIREKVQGKLHPEYIVTLYGLAEVYQFMGQYPKSLPLLVECLSNQEKTFGKLHPGYATALGSLAASYHAMGQYEKALALYQECLAIQEKAFGKFNPRYAFTLDNLAGLYREMGQYEKALDLHRECLTIREKVQGKTHPNYSSSMSGMAFIYERMGQYEKALPLYLESASIIEKAKGKLHPDYARIINSIGGMFTQMGQYEKGLSITQEALEIRQKALGKLHPDYALTLDQLAGLHQTMSQYEKALPLYQESLTIQEKALGKLHPDYAVTLADLAGLYWAMNQYEKALPLYQESLSIQENAFGKLHPIYAATLSHLAGLHRAMGQYEKALPLYQESLAIQEKALGKLHTNYATTQYSSALLYYDMNEYTKARSLFTQARQQYRSQLLNNISILNETTLQEFQNRFDDKAAVYSLSYIARTQSLAGQHYNDALLSKGVGLMATQLLNTLLTQTKDSIIIRTGTQLRDTKLTLNRQLTLPLTKQYGVDSLQRQAADLEQQLILRLPEYGQAFTALRVEWPQIQQALKPSEAAIEFVSFRYYYKHVTDSTLYAALVLRPGYTQPKFIFLGEQRQLDTLLIAGAASPTQINGLYRGGEAEGNNGQLARGRALSKLIWQPLDSLLQGVNTVYVSPAGRLHQIALAALPNPADTSQRMADRFQIRQVGSTRVVALRTAQSEQSLAKNTLNASLYGGITYEADSLGLVRQKRLKEVQQRLALREATRSGTWNYLPGTQAEIDNLSKILPFTNTTILTGKAATESSVKALSGHSPKILHIATHGFFFPDLPKPKTDGLAVVNEELNRFQASENPLLRSGLVMAGANYVWKGGIPIEGIDDGILTAYELSNLNLSGTELVVLSACETGLGQVKGSEGVYGLQRAVKMAGVRYLLMSLWRVSDNETAEYMTLLYNRLLDKGSVPEAYAYAQNQMRTKYPKEPFKWAAFVLVE